jgi:hypothetical protein
MVKHPYFQFPLCALSFDETAHKRLDSIISYAVIEAGTRLFAKLSAAQQSDFLARTKLNGGFPEGFKSILGFHQAALYGAEIIGINFGCFTACIERHRNLQRHVHEFESRHGRDAKVRIKKSWVFDARDGHGLTYREFSVLCAIYSAIGDKQQAIVTRDRIRRCALGYRTAAIMAAELPRRTDQAQPLTERQLRDTIGQLHRNKFFARCTVARRITYYSNRLDHEALRCLILDRRTYPEFFRASQTAQDQALTDAIKQRRRAVAPVASESSPPTPRFSFMLPRQAG